ncbi:hypothetical protein O3P69_013357 [Scylla paramamosain]|uniref:Uncharacterized protein n=1 Tax=Scylla paramamosain TaxID=85552 RepID=A0AAW0U195_SCYPA
MAAVVVQGKAVTALCSRPNINRVRRLEACNYCRKSSYITIDFSFTKTKVMAGHSLELLEIDHCVFQKKVQSLQFKIWAKTKIQLFRGDNPEGRRARGHPQSSWLEQVD